MSLDRLKRRDFITLLGGAAVRRFGRSRNAVVQVS
jgi:hypothetical protein